MLACLICKAKECEKDKRTRHQRPAKYPKATSEIWVILPNNAWDLDDLRIVAMCVSPAFPRLDIRLRIGDDEIRSQWNGPKYLSSRKGHQPEVPTTVKAMGMDDYLPELILASVKRVNACG
jgi:hypothetical protein